MKSFILADSSRGIYAAQHIAKSHGFQIVGLSPTDLETLIAGPDHEDYNDASNELFSTGVGLAVDGETELYHIDCVDGDWWAIHPDELTRFYEGLIHEPNQG